MRQRIRKMLLLISFIFFPVTMFYFSPFLIIMGATESIINGSCIVFLSLFAVSMFFGRIFCGWLCPSGALQELLFSANDKKCKGGKLNYLKFAIFIPWIITIISIVIIVGGYKKIDFFYQTKYGVSLWMPELYIIYYGVIIIVFVMSLIWGRRACCHYGCWISPFMIIGRKIRNFIKWPSLKLEPYSDRCIGCNACTNKCPMSLDVNEMVKSSKIESSECILCGVCVDVCMNKAIKFKFK